MIQAVENRGIQLTAIFFVRPISTVVVPITDPTGCNTTTRITTLELVDTACYTVTVKNTSFLLRNLTGILNKKAVLSQR